MPLVKNVNAIALHQNTYCKIYRILAKTLNISLRKSQKGPALRKSQDAEGLVPICLLANSV